MSRVLAFTTLVRDCLSDVFAMGGSRADVMIELIELHHVHSCSKRLSLRNPHAPVPARTSLQSQEPSAAACDL